MVRSAMLRAALSSLLVLGASCGARTGLSVGGLVDASADAPVPNDAGQERAASSDAPRGLCGAPDPGKPFAFLRPVAFGGGIATSGCTFAGTWVENPDRPGLVVDAVLLRVEDGAWTASKVVTVAEASVNALSSFIVWDGSEYVVAWTDGALFVRRLSVDGTLLGPAVRVFDLTQDGNIQDIQLDADGVIDVGLFNDPAVRFEYHSYFARLRADGTVTLPPTEVVPSSAGDLTIAFRFGSGGSNDLLWLGGNGSSEKVYLSTFDDTGKVLGTNELFWRGSKDAVFGGQAFATLGGDSVFGFWTVSTNRVEIRSPSAGARVDVHGGYTPALANLSGGELGVLVPTQFEGPTDFVLWFVDGTGGTGRVDGHTRFHGRGSGDGPLVYALAGGMGSFGVLWTDNPGAYFDIITAP
jgi:hypothetical protein